MAEMPTSLNRPKPNIALTVPRSRVSSVPLTMSCDLFAELAVTAGHCEQDALLLGGALANTVLLAKGIQVGKSRIDREGLKLLKRIKLTDTRIHIPVDVVVASGRRKPWRVVNAPVGRVPRGGYIYDIGPDTVALYRSIIAKAGTVLWGGPMGYFEESQFRRGTHAIARAVAQSRARSIIGGGDTLNAARIAGVLDDLSHVSIGGGAMLELLAGKPLPAVKPFTIR